jgi:hypothetical protein
MLERRESGQTVKQWCKENDICEKTYCYWQRKLRKAACEAIEAQEAIGQTPISLPMFKEVQLIKNQERHVTRNQEESESCEIRPLTIEINGIRMTASSSYPADQLVYIVREIIEKC